MNNILDLFKRITYLLFCIKRTINFFRKQYFNEGFNEFGFLMRLLQPMVEQMAKTQAELKNADIQIEESEILQSLSSIFDAQQKKDYVLLADYLELMLLPTLKAMLEKIRLKVRLDLFDENIIEKNIVYLRNKDAILAQKIEHTYHLLKEIKRPVKEYGGDYEFAVNNELKYTVELTEFGNYTLKVCENNVCRYLEANADPLGAATSLAKEYENKEAESYAVLGMGLGYLPLVLAIDSEYSANVCICEADIYILTLTLMFRVFSGLTSECITIYLDPDGNRFRKILEDGLTVPVIHYPSIPNWKDKNLQNVFERFFLKEASMRSSQTKMHANFKLNTRCLTEQPDKVHCVENLKEKFVGKDVYILAAGPSLTKNIDLLKRHPQNAIVLATGTVFKKMLERNLPIDYLIVSDPNDRVATQIEGREDADVPLIALSTTTALFLKRYQGLCYLAFQEDYPLAEEYAIEHGNILFQTGGSVSTIAMDVAVKLGAARVLFLGLDLAFTGMQAHAEKISHNQLPDEEILKWVPSWDKESLVPTDEKFNLYREWFEQRLKQDDIKNIEIVNATEGGSYIEGMIHKKLSEVIR